MSSFVDRLSSLGSKPAPEIEAGAEHLLGQARAAAKLRGYQNDPDVAALTIEKTRERVERVLLVAMVCGLAYTTVNVQEFVSGGALDGLVWWSAWLVEPFITAGVLALLRIEQVARRRGVLPGVWVARTRRAAFAATYTFNTWDSWFGPTFVPSDIVKHSVIPILVFCFAEALTDGRDALTRAAWIAAGGPEPADVRQEPEEPHRTSEDELGPPDDGPDTEPVPMFKPPKGYLKEVAIPAAYRDLATEAREAGRSLDSITLTEVDARAGTVKYVTKAMINPLREQLETEWQEERDGVPV